VTYILSYSPNHHKSLICRIIIIAVRKKSVVISTDFSPDFLGALKASQECGKSRDGGEREREREKEIGPLASKRRRKLLSPSAPSVRKEAGSLTATKVRVEIASSVVVRDLLLARCDARRQY